VKELTKTIGIIGGMGPAATLDLLTKFYACSEAQSDQEHVRVLADIDPTIPDRTEAILSGNTAGVMAHLRKNAQGLILQGADMLAMPCNTAHAFAEELRRHISVPLVSIIDVTVEMIKLQGLRKVGIMATDGTLAARLYLHQLEAAGIAPVIPDQNEQAALMRAIYAFKGGESQESSRMAQGIYRSLLGAGAEQVVAACTELPILLEGMAVIDPTRLLAQRLARLAVG